MSSKRRKKSYRKEIQETIRGRFSATMNGFGFVAREDGKSPDVFIPPGRSMNAITGDIVELTVHPGGDRGPFGVVTSILARTTKELTGELLSSRTLRPLDNRYPAAIHLTGSLKGAKKGDWLRVRLLSDPGDLNHAGKKPRRNKDSAPVLKAELKERIGKAGTIPADLAAIAMEYRIPAPYSPEENAAALRIRPRDPEERRDLTKVFCITLDPADARDFDDAISIAPGRHKGEFLLGVHIADVAAFIRPGSRFAEGAERRTFSSYMPGMFRPMLPEALTAKISMQEGKDSRAHTVLFTVREQDGAILGTERFHSLVRIRKRLDYDTVQAFLDDPAKAPKEWNATLKRKLSQIADLARKFRFNRRRSELFLNIETKDVRAIVDTATMTVTGLVEEKQRESEQLVEEFMLAANSAVASELIRREIPGLFRIHAAPAQERIAEFMEMMHNAFGIHTGDLTIRKECCKFLDKMPEDRRSAIVTGAFLRSLPRAAYAAKPALHYGLGKYEYSHFTSPIRRYTDLLIHQQLWAADAGKDLFPETFMAEKALYCSGREYEVDEAYFAANDRMKLHYLLDSGIVEEGSLQTFEGIIAKISASGILCEIPELGIYGFVPMKYLESRMKYRSKERRYRAEKGRGGYKVGNFIYLVIDLIDPAAGKAVFRPVS